MTNLKFVYCISVLGMSVFLLTSCEKITALLSNTKKESPVTIETEEEKLSYILGYILTENTKKSETHLQATAYLQGVKDSIQNKQPVLQEADIKAISMKIQEKALLETQRKVGDKNKNEGQKFLEDNKSKTGVVVTATGLQYKNFKRRSGTDSNKE